MNFEDFLNCGCFIAVPNLNKIWILTNFSSFEKNHDNEFAFYKNNFFLTNKHAWFRSDYRYEMNINDFREMLNKFTSSKPEITWEEIQQSNYKKQFDSLKQKINLGKLLKGVPFTHQKANYQLNKENLLYLLTSLFNYEDNLNLYLYGFWNFNENSGFLGASPELLFSQKGNMVETCALAGTISNKETKHGINNKIIREHKIVIDGIKKDLENLGEINVNKTLLLKFEKFSHLKSVLQIKLKEKFEYQRILASLHPTPALGAFPKKEGFNWLYEVEEKIEKRFEYCSTFGICIDKYFSLCIGVIRCLQWQNNILKITAGGGVIKESIFDDEWNEICMKIDSVRNYFKI